MSKLINNLFNSATVMTWGNYFSTSIKLLVFTPIILVKFSPEEISIWYLLLSINSFSFIIDLGFYPTFSRFISYAFNGLDTKNFFNNDLIASNKGNPNWELLEKLFGTINVLYVFLSFIVFSVLFIFIYGSIENVILQSNGNDIYLWIVFFVFYIGEIFHFFSKKYDAIFNGTNHVALINRLGIFFNLGNAISSLVLVGFFNFGLLALAINHFVFAVAVLIRNYFLERKICNEKFIEFKYFSFDNKIFATSWTPTWKSAVLIISSTGVSQASGMIFAKQGQSFELASFFFSAKLISSIIQFSQVPFYSKIQIFAGYRVKGQLDLLSYTASKAIKKSLFILVIGFLVLILFGDLLLENINSKTSLIETNFLLITLIVAFLERHHSMHAQIYVTTNDIPFFKTVVFSGIIQVLIVFYFFDEYSYFVFPFAQGFSNLLINNWWNVKLSLDSLNTTFWYFFNKSALIPAIIMILSSIIIYLF